MLKATLKSIALRLVPPIRRLYDQAQGYKAQVLALQTGAGDQMPRQIMTGSFRPNTWLVGAATSGGGAPADDQDIILRIIEAYRRSTTDRRQLGQSMWSTILSEYQAPLHQALAARDPVGVARLLRDPGASNIFFGIDSLLALHLQGLQDEQARQNHALLCIGGLVRLAESIGVLPVFNPESLYTSGATTWTADEVVGQLERALGTQLRFPNPFPNEHGVATQKGIVSFRATQSLYQAWRIRQIVKGTVAPRVLEIGAGLGRTPYYARLFGVQDYTIVDLPVMNAIQAYFLGRVLGDNNLLLYGESATDSQVRIKIVPPLEFSAEGPPFDLILNVDSLTEMDPAAARGYWDRIESRTSRFVSINHEGNPFTVADLIGESSKVARIERFPYWMRLGYVEEHVTFG